MADSGPIARSSLVDQVTARLRRDILTGALVPGATVSVSRIQRELEVSHIPIREAMRRLESEGLVETKPNRGPTVARVQLEDLHDIYELRRVIESHLIGKAAGAYTSEDLERIQTLLERLLASDPAATEEFWDIHHDFHWALYEPVLDTWARRILGLLWQSAERYHRLFAFVFGSVEAAHTEHRKLADAAAAGDGEAMRIALLAHLHRTEQTVTRGYLETAGEGDDAAPPPTRATEDAATSG